MIIQVENQALMTRCVYELQETVDLDSLGGCLNTGDSFKTCLNLALTTLRMAIISDEIVDSFPHSARSLPLSDFRMDWQVTND